MVVDERYFPRSGDRSGDHHLARGRRTRSYGRGTGQREPRLVWVRAEGRHYHVPGPCGIHEYRRWSQRKRYRQREPGAGVEEELLAYSPAAPVGRRCSSRGGIGDLLEELLVVDIRLARAARSRAEVDWAAQVEAPLLTGTRSRAHGRDVDVGRWVDVEVQGSTGLVRGLSDSA